MLLTIYVLLVGLYDNWHLDHSGAGFSVFLEGRYEIEVNLVSH